MRVRGATRCLHLGRHVENTGTGWRVLIAAKNAKRRRQRAFDSSKIMFSVSRDTLKITYKTSSLREAFMNAMRIAVQTLPDGRKINEGSPPKFAILECDPEYSLYA